MKPGPPRLVVRTTFATFAMVASILSAVFILVIWGVRSEVRSTVTARLEAGQRMLSALETRHTRELQAQVATLAENSTLKAAMDTFRAEQVNPKAAVRQELLETIGRELDKIAERIHPDVLAVSDASGTVLAAAGRRRSDWPSHIEVRDIRRRAGEDFLNLGSAVYHLARAPVALQDVELGYLELATALDDDYARQLSALSGTGTIVATRDRLIASTLSADATRALGPEVLKTLAGAETVELAGAVYASRRLFQAGEAAVYALDSIDASVGPAMRDAVRGVMLIAIGAFGLAGLASMWIARTLARPIDELSRSLSDMTRSRDFHPVPVTGSSLEVDALTDAFNTMMRTVAAAEDETRSAYVGAIRALALALDARDPYTAGHAERVSAIAVAIGRQMSLGEDELDVLRLGALLHDIGKIGVSDNVLRKPTALTSEEYELIKQHPALGARILKTVPFLAPHLPIVELHHERPDGRGYPHGLSRDETPLLARIVHVADAFDAITSARAYRSSRSTADALAELWRHSGTEFDAEVVQALSHAVPVLNNEVVTAPSIDAAVLSAPRRMPAAAGGR